jgi:osmotically-inducible protein OsmY
MANPRYDQHGSYDDPQDDPQSGRYPSRSRWEEQDRYAQRRAGEGDYGDDARQGGNRNWHERYGRAGGHGEDERFGGRAAYGPQNARSDRYGQPYGGQPYGEGYYSGSRGSDEGYGYGYGGRDTRRGGGDPSRGGYGDRDRGVYGYGHGGYGGRNDDNDRGLLQRAGDQIASWFDTDGGDHRGGDHRGKGPQGYSRSDQRIEDDVNDRLSDDPMVDATNIRVSVSGGEITLEGEVDSRQAKRQAEDCVDRISGVKHVQNNLRVRQPGQTTGQAGSQTGGQASGQTRGQSAHQTTGAGSSSTVSGGDKKTT